MGEMADELIDMIFNDHPFDTAEGVTCNNCGVRMLAWKQNFYGKWTLVNVNGKQHKCRKIDKQRIASVDEFDVVQ